jgi:spermidine synthase
MDIRKEQTSKPTHDDTSMPLPLVYEEKGILTLCLQRGSIQSQMRPEAPDDLLLTYTRTMLDFLQFNPSPQRITMIGLGGGSMAKWCYRHLPFADITVVEVNPYVISLRDRFYIPEDNHRFRVLWENGADYVARTPEETEVLIVDGYEVDGQPPELCSQSFYDNCYRALSSSGLMVVKLCDRHDQVNMARICNSFDHQFSAVMPEDGNVVAFARKGPWWPERQSRRAGSGNGDLA